MPCHCGSGHTKAQLVRWEYSCRIRVQFQCLLYPRATLGLHKVTWTSLTGAICLARTSYVQIRCSFVARPPYKWSDRPLVCTSREGQYIWRCSGLLGRRIPTSHGGPTCRGPHCSNFYAVEIPKGDNHLFAPNAPKCSSVIPVVWPHLGNAHARPPGCFPRMGENIW